LSWLSLRSIIRPAAPAGRATPFDATAQDGITHRKATEPNRAERCVSINAINPSPKITIAITARTGR
jgi:hypothetical protein